MVRVIPAKHQKFSIATGHVNMAQRAPSVTWLKKTLQWEKSLSLFAVGFYVTVMISNATQSETAQLLTPILTSATEICLRFWWVQSAITNRPTLLSDEEFKVLLNMFRYWLPAGSSNILAVHVLRSGELDDALWHRSGAPSSGWEVAEVTVSSPAKFHVSCFCPFQWAPLSHCWPIKICLFHSESLNCILCFSFIHFIHFLKDSSCPLTGGVSGSQWARHKVYSEIRWHFTEGWGLQSCRQLWLWVRTVQLGKPPQR